MRPPDFVAKAQRVEAGLVTSIVPVHNRAALMREAVTSILAQDYRPIEIIIVDDGSTDDTPIAARELVCQHPSVVHLIQQPNGGVGAAREAGRLAAGGEFIQYLDSDDLLLPGKFEAQVTALHAQPECGVAYGKTRYRLLDGSTEIRPAKSLDHAIATILPAFLACRWWETAAPLYRRSVTDRAGPWLPLANEEDWEYDCRVGSLGTLLCFVDRFVAEHRDHQGTRLSRGTVRDRGRMSHRARAHAAVLDHARRAGISDDTPEMRHFARALFLLCRQCGAAGLAEDSRMLLSLADSAAGTDGALRQQLSTYRRLSRMFGSTPVARTAELLDRVRGTIRRPSGSGNRTRKDV